MVDRLRLAACRFPVWGGVQQEVTLVRYELQWLVDCRFLWGCSDSKLVMYWLQWLVDCRFLRDEVTDKVGG